MFAKPYKLKSNNALKNSEKKHLSQRVQDEFPFATEERVKEILPLKGSCTCMKLVLHSGELVNVYVVEGVPMLVETGEGLLPTVCALWRAPDIVPVLTVHSPVLAKVQNGAPLYLPGVSLPAQGAGFPLFPRGAVLAARTEDNAAACMVGRAAISSADMLLRASGVCLDILHVCGDALCRDQRLRRTERPRAALAPAHTPARPHQTQQICLQPAREEWPSLGGPAPPTLQPRLIPEPPDTEDTQPDDSEPTESGETGDAREAPEDMDGLLAWCLLGLLKLDGRRLPLPLKTNLLYKNHLQPLCPPGRTLDVKKSSYKKLGKFLEAMQQEGLIEVREVEKGVSAVVAVNAAHPLVRAHHAPPRPAPPATPADDDTVEYSPPVVREMYCITANVLPLFPQHKKGTPLTAAEVRAALTEYVRARGVSGVSAARGEVLLDAPLAALLGRPEQEAVRWEALAAGVLAHMTASTELRFPDGSVRLSKTRLQPVRISVAQRSGNKKVTLVSNLEAFGFSLPALARSCQLRAAATCGVTRAPGAAADQLMLQGDQTYFVAKLLTEKYELPKKYIEGADKALKKKK